MRGSLWAGSLSLLRPHGGARESSLALVGACRQTRTPLGHSARRLGCTPLRVAGCEEPWGFPSSAGLPRACVPVVTPAPHPHPHGRGCRTGPLATTLEFEWQGPFVIAQTHLCPLCRRGSEPQTGYAREEPARIQASSRISGVPPGEVLQASASSAPPPPGWCGAPRSVSAKEGLSDSRSRLWAPSGPALGSSQEGAQYAGPRGFARCREDLGSRFPHPQSPPTWALSPTPDPQRVLSAPTRETQYYREPWECEQVGSFSPWVTQIANIIHCLPHPFILDPAFSLFWHLII
ncbi:hypothetical protein HJG60_009714 [Phyllostomus discolor]|uniref:Uncharacterized protein n=1 Tax=Phyllostomus discolor TaxID=89673 RepID=A0A834B9U7_9CHIR|nr:hypothetical protein HJG60_009714 [Phyllostomus discolor]